MSGAKIGLDLSRPDLGIARRLAALRLELFGENGHADIAKCIGVPVRSWKNFENGVTAPSDVMLKVLVLFNVEPNWLLNGKGPTFRGR